MSDTSDGAASERELSTLQALYSAQRADGSAIYAVSIQLVGIMVAYAAVSFTVLGSNLLAQQVWVRGLIAVPLWGLAAYVVVNGRVHAERTRTIKELESLLLQQLSTPLRPATLSAVGGPNERPLRQRPEFAAITLLSYTAAFSGMLGLSVYSVWAVAQDNAVAAVLCGGLYLLAASLITVGSFPRR